MSPAYPLRGLLLLTLLALGGCASVSSNQMEADVRQRVGGEGGRALQVVSSEADERQRQEAVNALLAQALDADAAVKLAMINNRSVQASLAQLGVAQAELAQASRISNPTFSFARKRRGDEIEYERSYGIDILGVIAIPWRSEIESRSAEQVKLRVAGDIIRLALATRRAWVDAVASGQIARYQADVVESAGASAELARRMSAVGNYNQLAYQRAQLRYAEATAQQAQAQQAALAAREALIRLLALNGPKAGELKLPDRLPDLPKSARNLREISPDAADKRLDLEMTRREVAGLARSLGLTRTTRFINVLETSYLNNSVNDGGPRQRGYELSLELPLFDWGGAKVARAEALYREALNRAAEVGINAESELRESHAAYRSQYELARHYRDEIVPLRKAMLDEAQLRYNGMLISVFELMADSREQAGSVMAAIDAQRGFWLADANLEMAMTAGSPPASRMSNSNAGAAEAGGH
ncbi:TolC family protein [Chitinimonas naiadis]